LRVSGFLSRYGEDRQPTGSDTTDTGVREMSLSLGLSLGVANLVAARADSAPVARKTVLRIFDQRPSEVGLPEETPSLTEPGLVMRGFVERVGDRAPLVAADGTKYLGAALTVEALEAMARIVDYGTPITIAVPAYWSEGQIAALREEFFAQPGLAPGGVTPVLISDATAAMTALRTQPGFPTEGVVALCDFGASGTSISLTNARSGSQPSGAPLRYDEFSGDAIDQLIFNHLRAAAPRLIECQRAKEQLSTATVSTIAAATADSGDDIQLSRNEFEQLISGPLDGFVSAVEETLQRNNVPRSALVAVAIVGGGAGIPLIAARLSGRLQVRIITAPDGKCCAAVGAATLGQQRSSAALPTTASPIIENPTEMVGTAGTTLAGDEGPPLAWSDDADEDEPVPYTGPEHTGGYGRQTTGFDDVDDDDYAAEAVRLPWYKRTALILILAGAAAAILAAAVLALTLGRDNPNPNQPAPPPPPETVTVTAPPPSDTTQPPVVTTTTEPPPPETTAPPPITTTEPPPTTTPPTTTQMTTTAPQPPPRERPWPPRRLDPWRR
jgi:hypothetical protein